MSVYGYERNTTPYIKAFTEGRSLFCENAFSNATASSATIASMLTGKLPTETKVYYSPDILRGEDAYQHLPAILRSYGYRNIDFGTRYYSDPYDLNMLNSFDESNFRKRNEQEWIIRSTSEINNNILYFLNLLNERVQDRFFRMTCQREITNPYDEVTGKKVIVFEKEPILKRFLNFIDESSAPFFAHIHLMCTHGPKFAIRNRVFSKGQKQNEFMMDDFFDDAVLEFDSFFKEIIQELKSRDKFRNTVFVIHTDHGMCFEVIDRLPLIFVFPNGAHTGRIISNVQNLDIAVTLLDYMGIPRPDWMRGHSLIQGEPPRLRPLFITSHAKPKNEESGLLSANKTYYKPPFYNLGKIFMIICDRSYKLDLSAKRYGIDTIRGHTSPCSETEIFEKGEAIRQIIDHLVKNGYNDWSKSLTN